MIADVEIIGVVFILLLSIFYTRCHAKEGVYGACFARYTRGFLGFQGAKNSSEGKRITHLQNAEKGVHRAGLWE